MGKDKKSKVDKKIDAMFVQEAFDDICTEIIDCGNAGGKMTKNDILEIVMKISTNYGFDKDNTDKLNEMALLKFF